MSQSANTNFITSFDTMVKQAYQDHMKLKETVRVKSNVKGSEQVFYTMDQGLATKKQRLQNVVAMNVKQGNVKAILEDWHAAEYSDITDLNKLSYNEKAELAKVIAGATGRRMDQLILDAIEADTTKKTVVAGGTGFTLEKLTRAKRIMDANGVPATERSFAYSAGALEDALLDEKIASSDYNTVKALANGELKSYAGFEFVLIADRTEGGLPLDGTTRTNYAYHKDAVGLAVGLEMGVKTDWVAEKACWLLNNIFTAGSVVIDPKGIVAVETVEEAI